MNRWWTIFLIEELEEEEKQKYKNIYALAGMPDKVSDWFYRHKVIGALFPLVAGLIISLIPFGIVMLIAMFYVH